MILTPLRPAHEECQRRLQPDTMGSQVMILSLQNLRRQYESGAVRPEDIIRLIYDRINAAGDDHVWICLVPEEVALKRARELAPWSSRSASFRHPFCSERQHRCGRATHYRRMSGLLLRAAANCNRRSEGARCRRDPDRQDEHGSVCNRSRGNSFAVWSLLQHLSCRLHFGGLQFRLGAGGRKRRSLFRFGHRHCGIGPRTGGF